MNAARHPALLILLLAGAEVMTMFGVFAFPALLPTFMGEWTLSNSEAGWISGIHLAAYAVSVPLLLGVTDRFDARYIYVGGALLTGLSLAAFALFAQGFWTAFLFRVLGGIGLGATYMPGLRVLVDRYEGRASSRAIAFYTASFSLGTASSFLVAGEVHAAVSWQAAYWVSAAGAIAAAALVAVLLRPVQPAKPEIETSVFDFRPVFKNRAAMGYVVAYCLHSWELFAMRAWLVAFLAFSLTLQSEPADWLTPTTVGTLTGLVAMVSSIAGGEIATRFGRRRIVAVTMVISAILSAVIGFLPAISYGILVALMLLYAVAIQADSAALTAGTVAVAEEGRRGATLGVHAFIGFSGGAVGPIVVGLVLDGSGGGASSMSWGLGFASMGVVTLLGPLCLYWLRSRSV